MTTGTATLHLGTKPVLAVRDFFLEIVEGPGVGQKFGPLSSPVRVGSAQGNEVVLDDPAISRFHFSLERQAGGMMLIDTGSTNGTRLGEYRVDRAYLEDGAVIGAGKTKLSYQVTGEARVVEYSDQHAFGKLLGESQAMRTLFSLLERLAGADAPVLIEGETGTGKELVARALHSEGARLGRPFVVVDCGATTPNLIESELFGHTKGAFTGAEQNRIGAFELAHGGTIFLDEIGELPLALQPKLLRALETGTFRPIGAERELTVEARVISATHRNLPQMVNEGRFREDLYFRLAVCPVHVPALRERLDDLGLLTRHFLHNALRSAAEGPAPEPSAETIEFLKTQPLNGNVRELRNLIERAVILGEPEQVRAGELAIALREMASLERRILPEKVSMEEAKRRFEREYLLKLITRHEGDFKAAAEEADIHFKSLQRLVRRLGLREELEDER